MSESEYLTLLGSIDDISHLLPFYEMWDISREIRKDEAAREFWTKSGIDDIKSSLNDTKYCIPNIRKLIETYGYHSDKELDVTYPCYYEDVAPLLISVKDMVTLGDEFSPQQDRERGRNQYKEILARIEKQVGSKKYKKIEAKIRNMRKMLWWREEFRDISTRFYYIIRIYTMELAKHFVEKNIIDEMDDIWFLKVGSIWDFLDCKISTEDIKVQIQKNKRYYNAYRNYMSENEIGGVFGENDIENLLEKSNLIKGLGANNGVITGTARVIEDFSEIHRLQENDILVTRFTDTGWTSKFAILSGIVTEYGGILCHAAIVSREYGIPAIVSCHDVMSKIKDGQTITIDGATGIVKVEK